MIEIILIAGIALLIIGTRQFLKKDEKESTPEEYIPSEHGLSLGEWDLTQIPEPIKIVKAIGKTESLESEPAKKKGRPKKTQ